MLVRAARRPWILGLSCCLWLVATARAQPEPEDPHAPTPAPAPDGPPPENQAEKTEPSTETTEAPSSPTPPAASPQALEKARKRFHQGVALAKAGNCNAAVAEFEASFRLVRRPNTLYNIAQCQERLFRYDRAIEYYERYLKLAPADHEDHEAVERALRSLRKLLATVHVESNVPAEVWIDGHQVGEAPGKVLIPAGTHSIELRAEGRIPARSELQVAGREEASVALKLEKARTTIQVTERSGMTPVVFWIGATATVVTAAVGGFFGTRALQLRADAEEIDARLPARAEAKADVERAALLADIFFASAGVLAVGTTVAFFATDWGPDEERAPETQQSPRTRLRWSPAFSDGYVGLQLRGTM